MPVRILSIDMSIPYGYNGCSGFLKENCTPNSTKIIPIDRKKMTSEFAPSDYITMGTDEDLTTATKIAIQEMVDFLAATKGLDKRAAYQLTSIAGNVVITQLVDQKVGVHVKIPKNLFR